MLSAFNKLMFAHFYDMNIRKQKNGALRYFLNGREK